jgi:sulfate transport system substrate-binding protein
MIRKLAIGLAAFSVLGAAQTASANTNLLNVSYDPTRELYVDVNAAFAKAYKAQSGDAVTIRQSHCRLGQAGPLRD